MGRCLGGLLVRTVSEVAGPYDVVFVGSGFASTFFLYRYLRYLPASARVLVLERGKLHTHADQLEMGRTSHIHPNDTWINTGREPDKVWNFTIGFGGGSNCWWGNSVRQHPSDFKIKSTYGVGTDWPLTYDDLENYYTEAEEIMHVSGPREEMLWPRSRPFPLPPHTLPHADRILKEADPAHHFAATTARPSRDTGSRPKCCANGVCHLCPIDSKFTILNSFMDAYDDPRVDVLLEAEARAVDIEAGIATGVVYRHEGKDKSVKTDLVVLGANALFNPSILQRSGLDHQLLGRNLYDNYAVFGEAFMDGIDHFQGSTVVCGMNYSKYDGAFRANHPSVLFETWNVGTLRPDHGKWRQVLPFLLKIEDLPQEKNYVRLASVDDDLPEISYNAYSAYALTAANRAEEIVAEILAPLPIESIKRFPYGSAGSHIHGTTMMGTDPATSVVDAAQVHHQVRNLVVGGSGGFPSGCQSNPTLTICAVAMRSADKLGASA